MSCKNSAGTIPRHGQANDIIKRALVSGNTAATREPLGVCRNDGKRPDGMSLYPYKQGKLLLWDFTCSDTLAMSHVEKSAKEAGSAAKEAETKKFNKYHELSHTYHLVPVSVETLGVWGETGLKFMKDVGKNLISQTGEKRASAFLFQSIGIAVQRGNAQSILGTKESDTEALDTIFLL